MLSVLDLDPGRCFRRVRGSCLLRDNSLHILLADRLEQVRAACYVIHIQNRLRAPRGRAWPRCSLQREKLTRVFSACPSLGSPLLRSEFSWGLDDAFGFQDITCRM